MWFLALLWVLAQDPKAEFESRRVIVREAKEPDRWCELGEWAIEKNLKDQAKTCFLEALQADAQHARAREGMRKLGFEELDGKWQTFAAIYNLKRGRTKKDDINGLLELARWCRLHQMEKEHRQTIAAVLKVEPMNRAAHEELGHKYHHGEWLSPEAYEKELKVDEAWKTALAENKPANEIQEAVRKAGGTWSGSVADVLEKAKSPGPGKYKDTKLELDRDKFPGEYTYAVPGTYVPWRKNPMIVFLHGGGQGAGDGDYYFPSAWYCGEPRGCIVVCPTVLKKVAVAWSNEQHVAYIRAVVKEMQSKYNIDPDRIYLWGHSMGGYGAFYIGSRTTDIFAAVSPMSGGPMGWIPDSLKNVPVRIVHGDKDAVVGPGGSRKAFKILREKGASVIYDELPGVEHGIPRENYDKVADWFMTIRKK